MPSPAQFFAGRLDELRPAGDPADRTTTAAWVRGLLDEGLLGLPLPGSGETVERFLALTQIARVDLDLARLAEGHADALAIIAELIGEQPDACLPPLGEQASKRLWGVWAANPPTSTVTATQSPNGWQLDGTKPWCSGSGCCDAALVTAQAIDGYRLFAVDLHHDSAEPISGTWPARAMSGCDSRSVCFAATPAVPVGGVDAYLCRPGFWHGAVGVAAAWHGGTLGIADALWAAGRRRPLDPHALAHAGAVDAALTAAEAVLDRAAQAIDEDPANESGAADLTARRARAVVERTTAEVIERVGRALGASPLALDAEHGKRVGDLQLYVRQSHAERDLAAHGALVVERGRQ